MPVAVSAPRTVGAVLDDSIKLWRSAFAKTWRLSAIAVCLGTAPYVWIFLRWRFAGISAPASVYASGSVPLTLSTLAFQIASIPVSYAILLQTAAVASQTPKSLQESLRRGIALLPRWLMLTLVVCLAALIAFIPTFVLIMVFELFDISSGTAYALAVLIIFLPICFYLFVRIMLYPIHMVVGDGGVFESLGGSWYLTRGHWWRVLATWSVLMALYFVLVAICAVSILGIYQAAGATNTAYGLVLSGSLPVLTAFTYPLIYAGYINMVADLKARKEGSDLVQRLASLSST